MSSKRFTMIFKKIALLSVLGITTVALQAETYREILSNAANYGLMGSAIFSSGYLGKNAFFMGKEAIRTARFNPFSVGPTLAVGAGLFLGGAAKQAYNAYSLGINDNDNENVEQGNATSLLSAFNTTILGSTALSQFRYLPHRSLSVGLGVVFGIGAYVEARNLKNANFQMPHVTRLKEELHKKIA